MTANVYGANVSILFGAGGGTFAPHFTCAAGTNPLSVPIGDLNQDARPDLVIANDEGTVSVLIAL